VVEMGIAIAEVYSLPASPRLSANIIGGDQEMDTEMLVALIASGTSLLVAIVGLVTSIITNRQSARSEKAIESLKFEFSRAASRETLGDSHLGEALKALQLAIQTIQHFKDEIQLILSAVDSSLDTQSALERLCAARERLFACHEEQMASLDGGEERAFHKAKNLSLTIEEFVRESLRGKANASAISERNRQRLTSLRGELTELQGILRDSRSDRLLRRIGNE
jgi:hypothetical protein